MALAQAEELLSKLNRELTRAETGKSYRTDEKNKLRPAAEHGDGRTTDETAAALETADTVHADAQTAVNSATDAVEQVALA